MIQTTAVAVPVSQPVFGRRSMTYFVLLLVLRFPLLILDQFLPSGFARAVLALTYFVLTFLFTALLIWEERGRLREFNIDSLALVLFALGKPLQVLLSLIHFPQWSSVSIDMIIMTVIALVLIITWVRRKQPLPGIVRRAGLWVLIAAVVGAVGSAVPGFGLRYFAPQDIRHAAPWSDFLLIPFFNMTNAGAYEEPLFRGFLWGYLQKRGWKEVWIWLFQAFLFTLGHIYYVQGTLLFSLLIAVPFGGLILGWLAWRSRSIGVSMVAHGFFNGIGAIIQSWP